MIHLVRTLTAFLSLFATPIAFAQAGNKDYTLTVGGTANGLMNIIDGLAELLVRGAVPMCITIIIIGGLMMAAAHGNESWAENGKKAAIGGIVGFCVVMGSYGILRMLFGFIYF